MNKTIILALALAAATTEARAADPTVPTNAWVKSMYLTGSHGEYDMSGRLVWGVPPGGSIGLSQLTLLVESLGGDAQTIIWLVASPAGRGGCSADHPASLDPTTEELIYRTAIAAAPGRMNAAQYTFPIPLAVHASVFTGACVYAVANGYPVTISASGITTLPNSATSPKAD